MKLPLLLAVTLLAPFAHAEDHKIVGTFESVPPDFFADFPKPETPAAREAAKKRAKALEGMKQTIVITEKDLTLGVGPGTSLYMTYTTQGDFILAKIIVDNSEMFYPIYAKDPDTLFHGGQKFVRKKEAAK